jgi:hypothetical protein
MIWKSVTKSICSVGQLAAARDNDPGLSELGSEHEPKGDPQRPKRVLRQVSEEGPLLANLRHRRRRRSSGIAGNGTPNGFHHLVP